MMIAAVKATRRRFFGLAGSAALAGKAAAEGAARQLTGGHGYPQVDLRHTLLGDNGGQGIAHSTQAAADNAWLSAKKLRDIIIRKALDTPERRAEIEKILYVQERNIHALDVDLAVNRSFSLAAKTAYQRQRNVRRALECAVLERNPYQQIGEWRDSIFRLAGIKF